MPQSRPRKHFPLFCLLLGVAAISQSGCDGRPKRVRVSGQVLIDGEPVTAGFVRVIPADARPAYGEIGPDGRFSLSTFDPNDGCVIGTHRVTVSAFDQSGGRWLAPKRYRDLPTSDLTATIDGPMDTLEIKLTWAGADVADEPERPQDMAGDADPSELE